MVAAVVSVVSVVSAASALLAGLLWRKVRLMSAELKRVNAVVVAHDLEQSVTLAERIRRVERRLEDVALDDQVVGLGERVRKLERKPQPAINPLIQPLLERIERIEKDTDKAFAKQSVFNLDLVSRRRKAGGGAAAPTAVPGRRGDL